MTQTNWRKSEVRKNCAFSRFKVCLITNTTFTGGVGVYTSHLYETLKSHNIELKLVCTDPLIDDPNVAILNKRNLFPLNHFLNYFINPKRLPKRYDVYHVLSQSIGIFAKNNRPSIVTVHDVSVLIGKQIMQPTPSFMSAQAKICTIITSSITSTTTLQRKALKHPKQQIELYVTPRLPKMN